MNQKELDIYFRQIKLLLPLYTKKEKQFLRDVNYPLSKANGLPVSQTSQPTISTGVNSDSSCPILLFLLYYLS